MSDVDRHDNPSPPSPLLTLIDLGHRARSAANADELAFLLVNETHRLVPYRQSALWFAEGGVQCLSGVVQVEANAPYVQWLNRLCKALPPAGDVPRAGIVEYEALSADLAQQWDEWLPRQILWISLPASTRHPDSVAGGLLLAGDAEVNANLAGLTNAALYPLLEEWLHIWHHAWLAQFRPRPWSLTLLREKTSAWWHATSTRPWWRRRPLQITLVAIAVLLCPVRLTVLAPGELVPAQPAVIRAPLDGVIAQFYVQPNAMVKAGQPLFSFDEAPIASRLEVARYALSEAQTEYRQQEMAISDSKSKGQLAMSLGKIGEKQADADYLESQFQRSHVVAPQDGVVLFDDPSEWIGRPVQTGEKIMKVAAPQDVEIEAWIPIGDAIPLPAAAKVSLYLAATPFDALSGEVRYLGHDALPRPDGNYAYRLRARLNGASTQRVGLKGTVKVQGPWVPLVYWVLRRPLALVRQVIAY